MAEVQRGGRGPIGPGPRAATALLLLAGALVLGGPGGCALPTPSDAQRAASLRRLPPPPTGTRRALAQQVIQSSCLVLSGIAVADRPADGDPHRDTFSFQPIPGTRWGLGLGVAVDARGYFLTAGHVLGEDPLTVVFLTPAGEVEATPRVVWEGAPGRGEPDLAILRVPRQLATVLRWSPAPAVGEALLACGLKVPSGDVLQGFSLTLMAGHVTRLQPPTRPSGPFLVGLDVPIRDGDSGGALVDPTGQLVALTTGWKADHWSVTAGTERAWFYGTRADPAAIARRIDADFAGAPAEPR